MKLAAVAFALLSTGSTTACSAPDSEIPDTAEQAIRRGFYLAHVSTRPGTIFFVTPETLATAADGWGPQSLALSVAQGFSTEVSYSISPSVSVQRDDVTTSLSTALGYSVTTSVDLAAASTVLVPTQAYYRLEAYPEYQVVDWSVVADFRNPLRGTLFAAGTVYRPVGVHFRALALAGAEWNALWPPGPGELSTPPPWAPGGPSAAAPAEDAGTTGAGGAPSTAASPQAP